MKIDPSNWVGWQNLARRCGLGFGWFVLSMIVCVTSLDAQVSDSKSTAHDPLALFRFLQAGRYMAALDYLEKNAADDSNYWQELATVQSFVGDYFGALQSIDRALDLPPEKEDPLLAELDQAEVKNALDEIVALARSRQIVILNEAHHVALHRAFGLQLAERLRPLGFEFLAAETLNGIAIQSLTRQQHPTRITGFYTLEPSFGDFIRQSLRLGYQPIAYEMMFGPPADSDPTDQINFREKTQVENLMKNIFTEKPNAKVFIFVGYHHATEDTQRNSDGRETAWMAARLKVATGIDPLTIDQTEQTERGSFDRSSKAWRWTQQNRPQEHPIVMAIEPNRYWIGPGYRDRVDIQVFHPASKPIDGRPDWLSKLTGRQSVPLPDEIPPPTDRYLVQAVLANESKETIPLDQCLWSADQNRPVLYLLPGEYQLRVLDRKDNTVYESKLSVESK